MQTLNPPWSRDELILALELYFRCKPNRRSESNAEIVELSRQLRELSIHEKQADATRFRSPDAVYMKLGNFLRLDPSYSGKGLVAGSKLDVAVWNEFANERERLKDTARAIRSFGTVAAHHELGPLLPEEGQEGVLEGSVLMRAHRQRERNSGIVRKKKALAMSSGCMRCEVCDFDYAERYGSLGRGFIECHHTVPLFRLAPGQVTRLADLSLVCANCHRVLHRKPGLTVSELRTMLSTH